MYWIGHFTAMLKTQTMPFEHRCCLRCKRFGLCHRGQCASCWRGAAAGRSVHYADESEATNAYRSRKAWRAGNGPRGTERLEGRTRPLSCIGNRRVWALVPCLPRKTWKTTAMPFALSLYVYVNRAQAGQQREIWQKLMQFSGGEASAAVIEAAGATPPYQLRFMTVNVATGLGGCGRCCRAVATETQATFAFH